MTISGTYQARGLTIEVWTPTIVDASPSVNYFPEGVLWGNLDDMWTSVSFTISADGGYWSFNLTMTDKQTDIEDWINDGIGRHIKIFNDSHDQIFEGFVNSLSANVGPLSTKRGPLLNIANRVSVKYALQDDTTGTTVVTHGLCTTIAPALVPLAGTQTKAWNSQLKYGIFEKVISGGTVWLDTQADIIRDDWLNELCLPETGEDLNTESHSDPTVTINVMGYIHFLKNYIYNNDAAGSIAVTNVGGTGKMQYILDMDPNALFSSANSTMQAVGTLVSEKEDQDSTAYTIINNMVNMGNGTTDTRMLFGVWNNRHVKFAEIPSTKAYVHKLSDPEQRITTPTGLRVLPWNVLPGEWILFTDYLIGKTQPADLSQDQRAMFIQDMTFTAPWALSLKGAKIGTVRQYLAWLAGGTV